MTAVDNTSNYEIADTLYVTAKITVVSMCNGTNSHMETADQSVIFQIPNPNSVANAAYLARSTSEQLKTQIAGLAQDMSARQIEKIVNDIHVDAAVAANQAGTTEPTA